MHVRDSRMANAAGLEAWRLCRRKWTRIMGLLPRKSRLVQRKLRQLHCSARPLRGSGGLRGRAGQRLNRLLRHRLLGLLSNSKDWGVDKLESLVGQACPGLVNGVATILRSSFELPTACNCMRREVEPCTRQGLLADHPSTTSMISTNRRELDCHLLG